MSNIKKNFVYQAFYEVLVIILPLITSPYVSRILGSENIGIYSYTYTISNYFVLFAALGIKNYGNREISRHRDNQDDLNKTFSSILFLHFAVAGLAMAAYFLYVLFIVSSEYKIYAAIQSFYLITSFFDISWLFFGLEKFKMTVSKSTLIRIFSAIATFLFVKEADDLWIYVLILAVSNFGGQVYLWLYVRRYVKICKVPLKKVFSHLPQMSILFIPTVATSFYNYMDKIMLGNMSGKVQLGLYDNAEKIIFLASNIIFSVGTVMLPRMSNLAAKGDVKKSRQYISDSMQLVVCMSCAMAFGLASISKVFCPVFWGAGYEGCSVLIMILSITLPFKGFASVIRTQYLIPNKKDKDYILSVCLGALVNLIVNYLLIPKMMAVGASIGTVFAEISVCVFQSVTGNNSLPIVKYIKNNSVFVLIGGVMFAFVYSIAQHTKVNLPCLCLHIFIGVIIYLSLCLIYAALSKNKLFFKLASQLEKNR